jgi:hypothetical protein
MANRAGPGGRIGEWGKESEIASRGTDSHEACDLYLRGLNGGFRLLDECRSQGLEVGSDLVPTRGSCSNGRPRGVKATGHRTNACPTGKARPRANRRRAEAALTIRMIFQLPLRQTEGFLDSLVRLLEIDLPIPDHTTLSRRLGKLSEIPFR